MTEQNRLNMNRQVEAYELPKFDGNPDDLFAFLNMGLQFLTLNGNTQQNVAKILGRLRGRAQKAISIIMHNYDWESIKNKLVSEFDDRKTITMLLDEMEHFDKRVNTFSELIEIIKNQLYLIRMKYENSPGIEFIMESHKQTAMHLISKKLPSSIRQQLIINPITFEVYVNKIKALENSREISYNYKNDRTNYQKTQLNIKPNYPVIQPNYRNSYMGQQPHQHKNNNQYNTQPRLPFNHYFRPQQQTHTYPPTHRTLMQRQQYRQPQQSNPRYNYDRNQNNNSEDRDVTMHSAKTQSHGIPLGRGIYAKELHQHENPEDFQDEVENKDST